jgi:DUF1365 family protein
MNLKSGIYEGTVRHRRYRPVLNQFRYRLFMLYLDLNELPHVFSLHPLWSYEKNNAASFFRADHLGNARVPLDQAVRELVAMQGGRTVMGPIRLLTHLRYFGYCFNPVSFYYCYDEDDAHVETIVAEVHNTPWNEEHLYVFDKLQNEHPSSHWRRHHFRKAFHVSPFMDMDIDYDWRFRVPGKKLNVHMIDNYKGKPIFDASLSLQRREMSHGALTRALFMYPLMTLKVITAIHWQALRLYLKGATVYTHPAKRQSLQNGIPRP